MKNVQDYTLSDVEVSSCPFDYYRAMRSEDPVHLDEKIGTYIVSRHEDIMKALAQPLVFSSGLGFVAQAQQDYSEEIEAYYRAAGLPPLVSVVTSDPPYHTRIRSLMDKAFTAHRVASMEKAMTAIADDIMDGFIDDGRVEFVGQFAVPFPIFVIADQLGISRSDLRAFKRWSDAVVEPLGRKLSRERAMWCAEQTVEMWHYLTERIAERRSAPREDMISDLVHARIEDAENPTLSLMELIQIVRSLIVAGNETTTTAIGNGLLTLVKDPSLMQTLLGAPEVDRALLRLTEELLRLETPVQSVPRVTTEDTELGGRRIPKGSLVLLGYASANRDEAKFECPESLNFERKNVGQHLAFGSGIHRCIGAMLARMEIKISMRQMITRLDNLQLAIPADELAYGPSMIVRSLVSLPVTFTRR
jgi:cytochrome P450